MELKKILINVTMKKKKNTDLFNPRERKYPLSLHRKGHHCEITIPHKYKKTMNMNETVLNRFTAAHSLLLRYT